VTLPSGVSRRTALKLSGAAACAPLLPSFAFAQSAARAHGMAVIGDLKYAPDFPHFDYVDTDAPRGGRIVTQLSGWGTNQNPVTFNTLNIFVLRGDGAAGMGLTFASLMEASSDEPGSAYGLVAKEVEIADDRLTLRFFLRPEAVFHDGSPITAHDVVFSLTTLRDKGHPSIATQLLDIADVEAEDDHIVRVNLKPESGRSLPNAIAGMPILSQAWWKDRDFEASLSEAPLGSGPYKLAGYKFGTYIEFERVDDWWADKLPVMVGRYNFERIRYEYYRDRTASFEAFKKGNVTFREENVSRVWATGYDFPALKEGKVQKVSLPRTAPVASQGWIYNLRREKFADPRIREALGLAFDFEWTRKTIMFGFYQRLTSYFENSDSKAVGKPSAEELALLEPWRGKVPDEVFGEPWLPPVSDGSGSDRALLRKADEMLRAAGCKRDGNVLKLPSGQPFEIEFLDSNPALQPHTQPFQANLKRLGINATSRFVDPAQYQRRLDDFDFDIITRALGGSAIPSDTLRVVYGSEAAKTRGSRNQNGISDPAVDAMIERIGQAQSYAEAITAAKCLDRLLRAGRYWIPMWWNNEEWLAYWDMFDRPQTKPKYGSGAPAIWWYDAEKAKRIGKA
jgi:microcin C transport system substrate-binding protein